MAERVFLAKGFADATMQGVATEAGASKETLYRFFGSKEELFAEVVDNRARSLRGKLDADLDNPGSIGEVLRDLGTNLLEAMTSLEAVSLLRMVVAETPRDPALGRLFYSVGPGRTLQKLTEFLDAAKARREFTGGSANLAASIFTGSLMSHALMECLLLGDRPRPSAIEIRERVDEAVALFMRSYVAGALD